MKLGPVTKRDKRNTARSKKIDEFSKSCGVIVIFPIYSQFGAIRKPNPGRIIYKTYIFNNSNLYLTKIENITKKFVTQLSYCLNIGTIFVTKY